MNRSFVVAALWVAFVPATAASQAVYVVKQNDSLSVIAQAHGIRTGGLAKANGLSLQSTSKSTNSTPGVRAGASTSTPSSADCEPVEACRFRGGPRMDTAGPGDAMNSADI